MTKEDEMPGSKKQAPKGTGQRQEAKPEAKPAARKPRAEAAESRKPQARPAAPEPQDEQDEQDTTAVRMVNATHGATQPGDVITVDREEGAGIVAAGYGLPVTDAEDGEGEDDDAED